LYWADSNTGQVMAISTDGFGSPFVLASGEADPTFLTANNGTVYWADPVSGAIWTVTVTDGIPSSPGELADGQNGPAYVAVDNNTVYWIDTGASTIMAVPATGGTPSVVASSPFGGVSYLAVSG
jgi:sugar lactone lactonase YvrE